MQIEPFDVDQLGPNSYDVRLARHLFVLQGPWGSPSWDMKREVPYKEIRIPDEGVILQPDWCCLGVTVEWTHTPQHIPKYEGRSTPARYFLQSHMTAGVGDRGYAGHWTLEIQVAKPLRIYPFMRIGQILFTEPVGIKDSLSYEEKGNYHHERQSEPRPKLPQPSNF